MQHLLPRPQGDLFAHKINGSPKISIVSNLTKLDSIPPEIRAVLSDRQRPILRFAEWSRSTGSSDACVAWFAGDRLLEGDVGEFLKSLHAYNRRSFVVVNTPCVEGIPFLTIQPRIFSGSASTDYWNFETRIEIAEASSMRCVFDSSRSDEPWRRLTDAVSREIEALGAGIDPLLRLWQSRETLPDIIAALVLRNLVATMLLHREEGNAQKFLEAGTKLYPAYAELYYLTALLAVRGHRFAEALPLLERAKLCGFTFPGSGGENRYRCDWLLGVVAARIGSDGAAFQHLLEGAKCNPPFEPSIDEILKLRLPTSMIEKEQYVLALAARRNPRLRTRIVEYLLLHDALEGACLIEKTVPVDEAQAASQCCSSKPKQAYGVVIEGPFFEHSSLARINRQIATALLPTAGVEVRLSPSSPATILPQLLTGGTSLTPVIHQRLSQTNLTIRHQWPPDLSRPSTGKLAVILPWEYGGVPSLWINQIRQNVDELWVPSNFVRDVFLQNGVQADRITVIPNGYDPNIFSPEGTRFRPQGCRDFVFLFVGGAIRRKGFDLLLEAYQAAFLAGESVTLVVLASGSFGAYQHNSLSAELRAASANPKHPHVLPIFETIGDPMLADLYRGADAFVLPYRGEGFGMPLLEAMACGKPVITTSAGPATDFCRASESYLVPAQQEIVPDDPPERLGPMTGSFTWFEPNFSELVHILRHVYENRREAAARGKAAAKSVRHLTWLSARKQYEARIHQLCALW